jgi:2-keto-4-pentenoate hydratase/2-oxohepta-3-ene-1,7-dioic acid hydratase in catechol pathway
MHLYQMMMRLSGYAPADADLSHRRNTVRFLSYANDGVAGLAAWSGNGWYGLAHGTPDGVPELEQLLAAGGPALADANRVLLERGQHLNERQIRFLPPLRNPAKIICVGLNYADHSAESGFNTPSYPALFSRFASSLTAHDAPIVRPRVSVQLDYEGEIAAVIGRGGRHIPKASALEHVAGYSIFNDGSVRDYQFKTAQWTIGKTFDATGAFGPSFITADELPAGVKGLRLETRLNGSVVQSASTSDMIFDIATLVSLLSEAITLAPGDVIVTGTPAGVGVARTPPLFMKAGDVCEVEVEGLGVLRNPIADEA